MIYNPQQHIALQSWSGSNLSKYPYQKNVNFPQGSDYVADNPPPHVIDINPILQWWDIPVPRWWDIVKLVQGSSYIADDPPKYKFIDINQILQWWERNSYYQIEVGRRVNFYKGTPDAFGAYVSATSLFSASMRKVKFKLTFVGSDTDSLKLVSNIRIRLDVKREVDSGSVTALASDGLTGTAVTFNKAFKDVESITLTVAAQQPITAIYRFVDIPNPTTFFVYAYDSSGNQVDYLISWKARGIV